MKILCHNRERGSVLMTSLIVGLAAGITLASYLVLISNRYRMTVRSNDWNKAMPVLESGIEEALTHLHDEFGNLTLNGWTAGTLKGNPVFNKFRTNSDGTFFWTVIITNGYLNGYLTNPIIFSSGFVPVPLGKGYICRTVEVATSRPLEFPCAVQASGLINFNGNNGSVDAYNSCNGSYGGTNEHIPTSIVTSYNADPAITMGNGKMYGTLDTGAGGNVTVGPNGSVGDSNWLANSSGIDPGYTNANVTQSFSSNSPPTDLQNYSTPPVITNATVLSGGQYQLSSLSLSSSPMIVTGPSTLYVSGNVSISGSGYIQILPGGSLTMYVAGGTTSVAGQGIINSTSSPENFSYIGLAGNTSISFGGSATFYGTINAPEADFSAAGNADIYGAAIVKSFTIGGSAWFHYDQCAGLLGNLVVASWRETF